MAQVACDAGLSRESLYKAFSGGCARRRVVDSPRITGSDADSYTSQWHLLMAAATVLPWWPPSTVMTVLPLERKNASSASLSRPICSSAVPYT